MEIADTILGFLLLGGAFLAFTIINYQIVFLAKKKSRLCSVNDAAARRMRRRNVSRGRIRAGSSAADPAAALD